MVKKILILTLFLYFLTLLQTSFFIHFSRYFPNLILITIVFINFFAPQNEEWWGIVSAILGGFFLDIFSENFFGYYILISLGISFFINFVLKKYVQIPIIKKI